MNVSVDIHIFQKMFYKNVYSLVTIDVLKMTTYENVHDKFLIRGLPVIISDATSALNNSETVVQFINHVTQTMNSMVKEEACSLETNLMMSSYATVEKSFSILSENSADSVEMPSWFVSFRNCNFNAVSFMKCLTNSGRLSRQPFILQLKASRLMMQKPYFYPRNLQAPSSSWILLSQNYKDYKNELSLYGLIIM